MRQSTSMLLCMLVVRGPGRPVCSHGELAANPHPQFPGLPREGCGLLRPLGLPTPRVCNSVPLAVGVQRPAGWEAVTPLPERQPLLHMGPHFRCHRTGLPLCPFTHRQHLHSSSFQQCQSVSSIHISASMPDRCSRHRNC